MDDLQPDQEYQFRVSAVRFLSAAAVADVPNINREVKGIFSQVLRIRTKIEENLNDSIDSELNDSLIEEVATSRFSDSQLAFIILGLFLGVCLFIAVLLKWVITDY